jgi:large subunit ribosomal protein L4
MKAPRYSAIGEAIGEATLPEVFESTVNEALLHQALVAYMANQRQGTSAVKTRAQVRGGGRKPWRQKHTGRARQGSIRSPHWRKGGIVFGPTPRDYRLSIPARLKRQALASALAQRALEGQVRVVSELSFEAPKTQQMAALLQAVEASGALLVTGQLDRQAVLSIRNLQGSAAMMVRDLNAFAVISHRCLVLTDDALLALGEASGR